MNQGRRWALFLATIFAALPALAAEPLGRLFLMPERRAALERQRQYNIQEEQTVQGASMRLDGIVQRSSGRKTIWINGKPGHDDASRLGITAELKPGTPGRATIHAGDEQPATLRVGETINRATRETRDGLAGGEVVVGANAPKR